MNTISREDTQFIKRGITKPFDLKVGDVVTFKEDPRSSIGLSMSMIKKGIVTCIYPYIFNVSYDVGPDNKKLTLWRSFSKVDYQLGVVKKYGSAD